MLNSISNCRTGRVWLLKGRNFMYLEYEINLKRTKPSMYFYF
jgi:hypothetical protein